MKETRYKADPQQPYGLHDCRISEMTIKDSNLKLSFEDEFTRFRRPGVPGLDVHGYIVVEGIDQEFCNVIIQGKGGSMGGFRGERLTIPEFTEKYKGFRFEVINEYYGWQRLQFTGWLWMPDAHPKEMTLSLGYFKGDVVYNTEE
jgi:hypothetical protein